MAQSFFEETMYKRKLLLEVVLPTPCLRGFEGRGYSGGANS